MSFLIVDLGAAIERWRGDVDAQPVAVRGTRESSQRGRETTQESWVWVSGNEEVIIK